MRWSGLAVLATAVCLVSLTQALANEVPAPAKSVGIQRGQEIIQVATAHDAVAHAKEGDIITLGPGTHQGPLVIKTPGITLQGEAGARVTANAADWKPAWSRSPQSGQFAYTADIPFMPVTMAIDQRVMIDAKENRHGLGMHKIGSGRNDRAAVRGVFTYLAKEKKVLVSFAEDIDPAQHVIEAAPQKVSAVAINADRVTVQGLILCGGVAGVMLENTNGSTVEKNLIYGCDNGVKLGVGAANCRVIGNDITWNADALNADTAPDTADVGNDAWHAHKKYGTYDKFGIAIEMAGENNEIAGNYLYDIWNGITTGDGVNKGEFEAYYRDYVDKGVSRFNKGLKVHHNRIDLAMDDALEPNGEAADNYWHGNVVTRARCAARLKTISMGPLYFYNNTMLDCLDGLRLYKSWPESAKVYIFNNVVNFKTAIVYHDMQTVAWDDAWLKANLPKGTPGAHLYHNIFIAEQTFANNAGDGKGVPPNFKGDYNLYTCHDDRQLTGRGIDKHSTFGMIPEFVATEKGDYRLRTPLEGSNLASLLPDAKLPVASNTIGLLQDAGKAPEGPVSGLWAIAEKPCNLGERDMSKYTLTPVRWIGGPSVEFVVENPTEANLDVRLLRGGTAKDSGYKIEVTGNQGQPIKSISGGDHDGVTLSSNAGYLKIRIEDKPEAHWRVDAPGVRVGVSTAKPLPLRKFDGVPAVFTADLAAGAPLSVTFNSKYGGSFGEVIEPGGERIKAFGKMPTTTAGTYKIAAHFPKSADLTIAGPAVVYFDAVQPIQLRPNWGKGFKPLDLKPAPPASPAAAITPMDAPADTPVPAPAPAGNLLTNGNSADAKDGKPTGWTIPNTQHDIAVDAADRPGAAGQSLKVQLKAVAEGQVALIQSIRNVPANAKLVLSGQMKGTAGRLGYLQVKLKKVGKELKREKTEWNASGTWGERKIEFDTGDADELSVELRFSQNDKAKDQTVWFADVSLSPAK